MNAYNQAFSAYSNLSASHAPRSIEVAAFTRVNALLRSARTFPETVAAIHKNRELWTLIATDVASSGNKLPKQLRAQLFYLAEFTHEHSRKVLKREAIVDPLMAINLAIINGLSGVSETS